MKPEEQPFDKLRAHGRRRGYRQPARLFAPLVEHLNRELGRTGAQVRWVPVRDNWVLAAPEVVDLLVANGALQGRASA